MITKKKEFTYRGKAIDELKALEVREFAKFLPSRQRRTVLRNFQEIENFISRAKNKTEKGKMMKTHNRDIVITPALVGIKIGVYSGKEFVPVEIIGEMLGHRLGEFSPTRRRIQHGKAGVGATKGSKHKSKK